MDTEYDFTQTINTLQLEDEIGTAGLPAPDVINTVGTAVAIFYTMALTAPQQDTLTTVVGNHVANPSYVPLVTQAAITTLLGYLNSATPSTASLARAMIVATLAPGLPVGALARINSQIAAALTQSGS